jgi:hypothetical protein
MPIPGFVPIKRKFMFILCDLQDIAILSITRFDKIASDMISQGKSKAEMFASR